MWVKPLHGNNVTELLAISAGDDILQSTVANVVAKKVWAHACTGSW